MDVKFSATCLITRLLRHSQMQIRIRFLGLKQAHTAKDVGILICQDLYRLEK